MKRRDSRVVPSSSPAPRARHSWRWPRSASSPPRPARSWRRPACGRAGCMVAYYSLGLGLAGLCFVAIHYTTGSTWSVAIRRVPEALAGTLPFSLALLAILFIVHPQLYGWTTDEAFGGSTEKALAFKQFWLSRPFFLVRAAIYSAHLDSVRAWRFAALAAAGPGRRSALDARKLPAVGGVSRAVRHHRHAGQLRLGDVDRVSTGSARSSASTTSPGCSSAAWRRSSCIAIGWSGPGRCGAS